MVFCDSINKTIMFFIKTTSKTYSLQNKKVNDIEQSFRRKHMKVVYIIIKNQINVTFKKYLILYIYIQITKPTKYNIHKKWFFVIYDFGAVANLILLIFIGVVSYLILLLIFKNREIFTVIEKIKRRFIG